MLLPERMSWPELTQQGFALAATMADDRGASLAARGLAPSVVGRVTRVAEALEVMDARSRRREVARMAALLAPPAPEQAVLPPRAQALLASQVPKEIGRRWLAAAPAPRPGYAPEPGLRTLIAHFARLAHAEQGRR